MEILRIGNDIFPCYNTADTTAEGGCPRFICCLWLFSYSRVVVCFMVLRRHWSYRQYHVHDLLYFSPNKKWRIYDNDYRGRLRLSCCLASTIISLRFMQAWYIFLFFRIAERPCRAYTALRVYQATCAHVKRGEVWVTGFLLDTRCAVLLM